MKCLTFVLSLFLLISCANEEKLANQPTGPWTYPITGYRAIKNLSARKKTNEITRLVGWDEGYYYFDWSLLNAAISRGSGRVDRKQFDHENRGALTLEKGQVTLEKGQVRTLILE